jgi:SAM-dependent methyltransferase
MPDFSKRSYVPELLDDPAVPFEDIRLNMQELEFINTRLGGHAITLKGILSLMGNRNNIHICEIGCGGGDNLKAIEKYCLKMNVDARFTGIDIKDTCIRFARENTSGIRNIDFICSDYRDVKFTNKPDIIFSSLFCHHFTDNQVIDIIEWKYQYSKLGFFINDLHRHPMAYHSIRLLSRAFSKSYLVKNDAPLSVQRGFTRSDWKRIFADVDILGMTPNIQWKWAFRWLITVSKDAIPINQVQRAKNNLAFL